MKRLPPTLLLLLWALVHIASALTPFTEGAYEFETCGSNCTLTGSWATEDWGATDYLVTSVLNDAATIEVVGNYLIIDRHIYSGAADFEVCVNASCTTYGSNNSWNDYRYGVIIGLTGGTDTITIKNKSSGVPLRLDRFVILGKPDGTPQPSSTPAYTATPQPTSTPAYTATPQPTWTLAPSITPQPTSTPMVGGGGGSDPASVYATVESGQITRFDYVATAGNVHIANLLAALFFSAWAMFFVGIFIVWRDQ